MYHGVSHGVSKIKASLLARFEGPEIANLKLIEKESMIDIFTHKTPWLQNVLIINSWPHCMKGGKEFREVGIK